MSYIKILRPGNFIFVGVCVLFGALYPDFSFAGSYWQIIAAAISAMIIAGAGYAVNDYYDLEIDLINKPHRVLPSGKLKRSSALIYSIILFFCGIILSYFSGSIDCLVLAFINSILLFLYALIFKKRLISGNLLVAWAAASTFLYGGFANDNLRNSLIVGSFAFLYTLLREIVKDMEDKEADKKNGATTLAVIGSKKLVLAIFLVIVLVMAVISAFYYTNLYIDKSIAVLLLFLVIMPLLVFYRILSNSITEKTYRNISKYMKYDMLILLIIFLIGNSI